MGDNDVFLRLLTLEQTAGILRVRKRTLLRMIRTKEFPAFKVGGQWRVWQNQLERWLEHKEGIATSVGEVDETEKREA